MNPILRNFLMIDIPILLLMGQVLIEIFVPDAAKPAFHSETGPHETVQGIFLALALPIALFLIFKAKTLWLKAWTALAALCVFYVLGEELSWGQHIFGWATSENWAQINDQGETNLHNTSSWLDQKPRIILELGVLVGGIIIPGLRRWKPELLPAKFKDIYPDNIVVFTALCALGTKLINIPKYNGHNLFWRESEIMELLLYYFVLLYLIGLWKNWRETRIS